MKTNENVDALTTKELLKIWEENENTRKKNESKLIQDTVNAMMLPQIQAIQDRQDKAYEKCERNIIEIHKRPQNRMKKWGGEE